jgi:hypothetical protein
MRGALISADRAARRAAASVLAGFARAVTLEANGATKMQTRNSVSASSIQKTSA